MSCKKFISEGDRFFRRKGESLSDMLIRIGKADSTGHSKFDREVSHAGYGCVNKYAHLCGNVCDNLGSEKNRELCFACLADPVRCSREKGDRGSTSDDPSTACCPIAKTAVECSDCVARTDRQGSYLAECYGGDGGTLNSGEIGAIAGGVIAFLVLVIAGFFGFRALQKKAYKSDLASRGVNTAGMTESVLQKTDDRLGR